ncbi:MAG TPA: hypothetical protein VII61_00390, partial [Ktedonobacteraceae bacterium]
ILPQPHQLLILLMAGRATTQMTSNFSNLMGGHRNEGIGGTRGFIIIGKTGGALITGQHICAQQVNGKADQTMTAERTGVDMSNNLPVDCCLLPVPLPIHI